MSLSSRLSRRRFIHGLGLGVASGLMVGCGSSDAGRSGLVGGNPTGSSTTTTPSSTTVNLNQIGGSPLRIVSGRQAPAGVDASGNVTVVTPDNAAQVLFAVDGAGNLRGLTIKIPGQSLSLDAASTALALVFLVPGIMTTVPALAAQRATRLQASPSFNSLVQRLASLLPTNSVTSILPQIQTLLENVILEATGPIVTPKVFTGTQAITAKPGGLRITPGRELSAATGSFTINNGSFRYVSVVRQFFTARGTSAQSQRTNLIGAPFTSAVSVIGSANGYSVGNFATGQVGSASNARDDFSLLEHNPILEHVTYYLRGLGYAGHPDNADLPQDVSANLFEDKADLATLVLSVLFPFVEVALGAATFARFSQEELLRLVSQGPAVNASNNVANSANTGDSRNVAAAFLDAFNSILTLPAFAEELAILLGEGVLATFVTAALEVLALALSAANFLATALDVVSNPRLVAIEVPVPMSSFSDQLASAPEFNVLLDVNTQGTVLFQSSDGSVYRKKAFAAAQLLGNPLVAGQLSDEDDLITYQDQNANIFLRNDTGTTGSVTVPNGLDTFIGGSGPLIDPKGKAVAAPASVRANGRAEIFLFDRNLGDSISLGTDRVRAGGLFLGGLNADTVFARGALGSTTTQLARYDRASGVWSSRTVSAAPNGNLRMSYRGVNRIGEALLHDYRDNDDGFNPVSSIERITVETVAGLETVFQGGLTQGVGGIFPDPLGINDDGEILASIATTDANFQNRQEETFLFRRRGGNAQIPLSSLLPRGMPAGTYRGLGLGGKYIVASRVENGSPVANYLIFLGRSPEDVTRALS
ncbi:hypothetical protein JST97_07145 [bacterium]|nr:hypothetical protein [bacterium]